MSNKQEATYGPIPDPDEMTYGEVLAVARREVAHDIEHLVVERDSLRAEVERLTADWFKERDLRADAEARLRKVEELADEIRTAPAETWGVSLHVPSNAEAAYMAGADAAITFAAERIRAALAAEPAEVTPPAEQRHPSLCVCTDCDAADAEEPPRG